MFTANAMRLWALLLAEAAVLSGCYRSPMPHAPVETSAAPAPLSEVDLGASVLAEVDNARLAIAQHDLISAGNDVHRALLFARQLVDRPSTLFPSETVTTGAPWTAGVSATGTPHARLTAFGVQVKLATAQAELNGGLDQADADLRDIQQDIPKQMIPSNLLLLRAAASLDLARTAAFNGRISDLRTQLLDARVALNAYAEADHMAQARRLAAVIDQSIQRAATLNTLLPAQISLWLSEVVAWAGSDRWSAPIR